MTRINFRIVKEVIPYMLILLASGAALTNFAGENHAAPPVPDTPVLAEPEPASNWKLKLDFSDEFNGKSLDQSKWNNDPDPWGTWTWDPENAFVREGRLFINVRHEPHERDGRKLFYKSGIIRSRKQITTGYFEARIKGATKFPGICPAFWIIGHHGGLVSEIDFVELQEVTSDVRVVDCNIHARVRENGELVWKRERRDYLAPFDPRDDFHIYGCDVTPEWITWYLDGKPMLRAKNDHWQLPMDLIFSTGLRRPLQEWGTNAPGHEGQTTYPVAEASTPEGFPSAFEVDWVRVWDRVGGKPVKMEVTPPTNLKTPAKQSKPVNKKD